MLRKLYRASGFVGSAASLLALTLMINLFVTGEDIVNPVAGAAIVSGLAVMSFIAYFSFFDGAQPGHFVRAINIWLCAAWSWLTYFDYASNRSADLGWSAGVWTFGALVIFFNARLRPILAAQYRDKGRIDYFEIYFPRH